MAKNARRLSRCCGKLIRLGLGYGRHLIRRRHQGKFAKTIPGRASQQKLVTKQIGLDFIPRRKQRFSIIGQTDSLEKLWSIFAHRRERLHVMRTTYEYLLVVSPPLFQEFFKQQ